MKCINVSLFARPPPPSFPWRRTNHNQRVFSAHFRHLYIQFDHSVSSGEAYCVQIIILLPENCRSYFCLLSLMVTDGWSAVRSPPDQGWQGDARRADSDFGWQTTSHCMSSRSATEAGDLHQHQRPAHSSACSWPSSSLKTYLKV